MSYSKTTWTNGVTPINETNLNKIENELENLENNKIDSIFGAGSIDNNLSRKLYYVDNVNGDDTNNGTSTYPFKTLVPIIKKINKGELKIDIVLAAGQTHEIPLDTSNGVNASFNACTLHIMSTSDTTNAILTTNRNNSDNSCLTFYNCHGNFYNITFENIGKEMYFDGGSMLAYNCNFNCKVAGWGAAYKFDSTIVKTLKLRMSNVWAINCTLGCIESISSQLFLEVTIFNPSYNINPDDTLACYIFKGSSISITGVSYFDTTNTPSQNTLLWSGGSSLFIASTLNLSPNAYSFSSQSTMSYSKIITTTQRLTALQNAANGINYTNGTQYQ